MTCTKRAATSAHSIVEIGRRVFLKIVEGMGVVTAHTTETPPRYVVRMLNSQGWTVEMVASHAEIEASELETDPRANLSYQPCQCEIPKPRLIWGPPDSRGEMLTQCRRFSILVDTAGLFIAHDRRYSYPAEYSTPLESVGEAQEWCAVRIGATTAEHGRLTWLERDSSDESGCGRFTIHRDGIDRYHAVDMKMSGPQRYSPPGTLAEAKAWCEVRSNYLVCKNGEEEELIEESCIPF